MILKRFSRVAHFETLRDPSLEEMLTAASRFAASINFVPKPRWLTFCGVSGNGKTHLARAIFRQFMEQNRHEKRFDPIRNRIVGNTGMFCDWRKLCKDLQNRIGWGYVDDLCEEWFAVIDDIGTQHDPNGFLAATLDRVANARLGKWTVWTANIPLKEIASKIDVRVADRMIRDGGEVIECSAPSYNDR